MSYTINGVEKEVDDYGYLLEPDFSEEAVQVIAAACGITLTDQHWKVVNFLRPVQGRRPHAEHAQPDQGLQEEGDMPEADSALLFELFPDGGAAKRAARSAACRNRKAREAIENSRLCLCPLGKGKLKSPTPRPPPGRGRLRLPEGGSPPTLPPPRGYYASSLRSNTI
jgi:sulfur relay (sulfurtransferase) DsrC/TusE family protein